MKIPKTFFMLMLTAGLSSCFRNFYQTNTTPKIDSVKMERQVVNKKVFIIHTYAEVFKLSNVKTESGSITGEKTVLDPSYSRYTSPANQKANAFRKKNQNFVFSQVHLYTMQTFTPGHPMILSDSLIFRVDEYGPDIAADKQSRTASIIGLCAVPVVVIGIGVLAASSMSNTFTIPVNWHF